MRLADLHRRGDDLRGESVAAALDRENLGVADATAERWTTPSSWMSVMVSPAAADRGLSRTPGRSRMLARSLRFRLSWRKMRSSVSLRRTTNSTVSPSGCGSGGVAVSFANSGAARIAGSIAGASSSVAPSFTRCGCDSVRDCAAEQRRCEARDEPLRVCARVRGRCFRLVVERHFRHELPYETCAMKMPRELRRCTTAESMI